MVYLKHRKGHQSELLNGSRSDQSVAASALTLVLSLTSPALGTWAASLDVRFFAHLAISAAIVLLIRVTCRSTLSLAWLALLILVGRMSVNAGIWAESARALATTQSIGDAVAAGPADTLMQSIGIGLLALICGTLFVETARLISSLLQVSSGHSKPADIARSPASCRSLALMQCLRIGLVAELAILLGQVVLPWFVESSATFPQSGSLWQRHLALALCNSIVAILPWLLIGHLCATQGPTRRTFDRQRITILRNVLYLGVVAFALAASKSIPGSIASLLAALGLAVAIASFEPGASQSTIDSPDSSVHRTKNMRTGPDGSQFECVESHEATGNHSPHRTSRSDDTEVDACLAVYGDDTSDRERVTTMHLFTGRSITDALGKVRSHLGPSALLISSRHRPDGVEVLAMKSDGLDDLQSTR